MTSRFAACRVRPANRNLPSDDGTLPACWLLIEWPENTDEPTDYWLSTLPENTPISELVRLGKIRGGSSMTTANSNTGSGSITSGAGPGWVGITTSRW